MSAFYRNELVAALNLLLWVQAAEDRALIRAAVQKNHAAMWRIHLICRLLYASEESARLLDQRVGSGETVRDLLAAGKPGIARLQEILVALFRDRAPREIYDQGGEASCPDSALLILLRLLEARREEDLPWRNPLSENCGWIVAGDARLAQAVLSAGRHLSGESLCELIVSALQDRSEAVRCMAARMAANLGDIGPVLRSLSRLSSDEIGFVRRAALETLALFNSRDDVAASIAGFSHDRDPTLRRLVVKLLLEDEAVYCDDWRLAHLAFDSEAEIAEIARGYFGRSALQGYLRRLAHLAAKGGALHPRELEILAKPAYLERALRLLIFSERLRRLDPCGEAQQLALTVAALEAFSTDLGRTFWRAAAAALDARTKSVVAQSLAVLRAKAKTAA